MALTFYKADITQAGQVLHTTSDDFDVYVDDGVVLGSTDEYALGLFGSNHDIWINGTVAGAEQGILLGTYANGGTDDNHVEVAAGGLVLGHYSGIASLGEADIVNHGEISGAQTGVSLWAAPAKSRLVNDGTISGGQYGVAVTGWILSGSAEVVNFGLIEGPTAIHNGDTELRVVNRGTLEGSVTLGGGNDRFDNRGGTVTEGWIAGGEGYDTFLPGAGEETIDGGGEFDTLDFRTGGGLRLDLLEGTGTGRALGDAYYGIEEVLGSKTGADVLMGHDSANTLRGHGGADRLGGPSGEDRLEGGWGADRLTGGSDADSFVYLATGHGGDVITDFDGDRIQVSTWGFDLTGSGQPLDGALFRSRGDNHAQDADDRFVFRTTDRTLWFDADGSGEVKAVMLADLQAGAALTAGDIWLL